MTKSHQRSDLQIALDACKQSFIAAGAFSLFINLLMLVPSLYMLQVYDRVVTTGSHVTLLMLTLVTTFLFLVMGSLEWVRSQILIRSGAKLDLALNQRLFDAVFKQCLLLGGKAGSSQPLADLLNLRQFLTGPGLAAFFDAPWMPIYLALLFVFHPSFGFFALFCGAVLAGLTTLTEKLTRGELAQANRASIEATQYVTKNLRNAEIIESMGMLANIRQRWLAKHQEMLSLQAHASTRAGLLHMLSKVFRILAQSLALGLGALLVLEQEISPGLMIAGSILLGRALAPIDQMTGTWKHFLGAREAYNRLHQFLLAIPPARETMTLPAPKGHLQAEQAVVVPPGSKTAVLKGISFALEAGSLMAVVGPSAAGKSTLARALLGLWPPHSGTIRLDGADISGWNREELGAYIGYLPQDIELFDGTVSENIARFGTVDPEKVVRAAQAAGVHDMILRLPEGYDTVIGGLGGVLSGGQMQRIGLARALYGDPVLVVLDEPNSNLDDRGEVALQRALLGLKQRGATAVIISHRLNILNLVDKILVLNEGTMVSFGSRQELLPKLLPQPQIPPSSATASLAVGAH
ncbi:type I secretion system permease/ATPase [Candidatus Methylocalor cossyra]|uniref:Alkaline protease secretion ATP-binding protein AprD n=1 Tax=Candidatus Methylocalor cossyra TaxID=3108543 RepID=A0ABM9NJK8_9GAMM